MKTKQIMKIEYTEPLMKVKEMRRRRCVVASVTEENFGYYGSFNGGDDGSFTENNNAED